MNITASRRGASGSFDFAATGDPNTEIDSSQGKPSAMPLPRKNWRREKSVEREEEKLMG
jgi:hypothetical protein